MQVETHAVLSPSASSRWMVCPGSILLEASEPNVESDYAKEGTLAHALAAHCLEKGIKSRDVLVFEHKGEQEVISQEMSDYVQEYMDYVTEQAEGNRLLIEQKLELEWITKEKDAKGTADAVIISKDGSVLNIVDLKYGRGLKVDAQDNSQLRIYGLAAQRQFDMLGDFKTVRLHIHQPRLDHVDYEDLSVTELASFRLDVWSAIEEIEKAKKSNSLDGFLKPGGKQCKFCRAAGKCPALAKVVADTTGADFEDETQTELVAPVDLGTAMSKVPLLEIWAKSVRGKVEAELLSGQIVKGWKLVEGKKGARKYIDERAAENEMKALNLDAEDMYETKLLSPAKLEKKLKKKPGVFEKLQNLFTQSRGKPSVAPISDPRPKYDPKPGDDFEEVE